MMSRIFRLVSSVAALACLVVLSQRASGADAKTFVGEIADTQCALNVHSLNQSHKEMMGMKPELKTEAACARYCVKERGGRYVLQTKEKVYKFDAQVLAEEWAGQKVKVVGTLDPKAGVITVEKIEALVANPSSAHKPN
jgi:uncharacterized protein DUF5818